MIFSQIIEKILFTEEEEQISTDLKIYLIKFSDKIINICQGDIILNHVFLNNLIDTMIPIQKKDQHQSTSISGFLG
jgi:hypothetical protein